MMILKVKIFIVGNVPVFPDSSQFMKSKPLIMKPYNPPQKFHKNQMDISSIEVSLKMKPLAEILLPYHNPVHQEWKIA